MAIGIAILALLVAGWSWYQRAKHMRDHHRKDV